MRKDYNDDLLNRLKREELDILKKFDKICTKYKLNYFVLYGTAIGTVRHQGFVPWDDDIDVGMFREDYEKFKLIAEKELGEIYRLSTPELEKFYSSNVVKIQKNGTKFIPPYAVGTPCDLGVHMDIFVFDKIPSNKKQRRRQKLLASLYSKLLFLRFFSEPEIDFGEPVKSILGAGCKVIHCLLSALHVSPKWLYRKFEQNAKKYNWDETLDEYSTLQDPCVEKSSLKKSDVFPLKYMMFEDIEVPMMCGYDAFMRKWYGDYMQLPPIEKRVNHAPEIIDLGDGK